MTREQMLQALLERWANMFEGWKTMGGDAEGNPQRRAECSGQAQAYSMCIADLRAALAPESGGPTPGEGGPCRGCGESFDAKAEDVVWDGNGHSIGVATCPRCQYPALVKMDQPSSPSSAQGEGFVEHVAPSSGEALGWCDSDGGTLPAHERGPKCVNWRPSIGGGGA